MNLQKLTDINTTAVGLFKGIKILSAITWPLECEHEFLGALDAGQTPKLPQVQVLGSFSAQKGDTHLQWHLAKNPSTQGPLGPYWDP